MDDADILAGIMNGTGYIVVPRRVYVPTKPVLLNGHDATIDLRGVTIQAAAGMDGGTSAGDLIRMTGCRGVTLLGGTYDGNRQNRTITSETPQTVHVLHGESITFDGGSFVNAPNDDIFIWGGYGVTDDSLLPKHVKVLHGNHDGARRNAISVVGGQYVTVDDNDIANVRGTAPFCGVDVEPNAVDTPGLTRVVVISNNRVVNCGCGLAAHTPLSTVVEYQFNRISGCDTGIYNESVAAKIGFNICIGNKGLDINVSNTDLVEIFGNAANQIYADHTGIKKPRGHKLRCNACRTVIYTPPVKAQ